jgi:hypothetical protein
MTKHSSEYRVLFGSDVQRDGTYVELSAEHDVEGSAWIEVFRSDVDAVMTFSAEARDLPMAEFERWLARVRREYNQPVELDVTIDADGVRTWQELDRRWASAFGFPEWYGYNRDAWIDCMRSLDVPGTASRLTLPLQQPVSVTVRGSSGLESAVIRELVALLADVNAAYREDQSAIRIDVRFE